MSVVEVQFHVFVFIRLLPSVYHFLRNSRGCTPKVKRRENRQKRNKRILLLVGLLILAGQIGVGLLLDQNLLKVRFPAAEAMINAIARLPRQPDIVFMGSSRFEGGINVAEIRQLMEIPFGEEAPQMFNASIRASDPYSMHFLMRMLADRGVMPRMVVLEISPETVTTAGPFQNIQVARLLTWKDMPVDAPDLLARRQYSRLLSSRLLPIFLYRRELLTWLIGSEPPYLTLAETAAQQPAPIGEDADIVRPSAPDIPVMTQEQREAVLRQLQAAAPTVRKWLRDYRIAGLNPRHLESMLKLLRTHKVTIILVGVPVSQPHYDCYTHDINQKFLDYMSYLSRTYGCRFVDYRNRVPDEFFRDTHHLTKNGGAFFSRMLQEEVLCEAWRQSSKVSQHAHHPLPPNSF